MKVKVVIPPPAAPTYRWLAVGYAGILGLLSLYMLMHIDTFVAQLQGYINSPGILGITVAVLTITSQVFAVPFLLRLRLSPLARVMSVVCVVGAPAWWLLITLSGFVAGWGLMECPCALESIPLAGIGAIAMLLTVGSLASFYGLSAQEILRNPGGTPTKKRRT